MQLAPDEAQFIARYIQSVEQLEILILLRLDRERAWTPAELATQMRTSEGSAFARLVKLTEDGLVTKDEQGRYRFARLEPDLDAQVAAVATAYVTRRHMIIDAIFASPQDKLSVFADAFRLRTKKEKDGG